jgi:hypothetical protein
MRVSKRNVTRMTKRWRESLALFGTRGSLTRRSIRRMTTGVTEETERRDWVASFRSYMIAWGLPTAALVVGIILPPSARTIIWSSALVWMGVACILNALRCGRIHCFLTGPFFLLMAAATLLHGFEILWLGPNGWVWLGASLIVVGGGLLWFLPERLWGKYSDRSSVQ